MPNPETGPSHEAESEQSISAEEEEKTEQQESGQSEPEQEKDLSSAPESTEETSLEPTDEQDESSKKEVKEPIDAKERQRLIEAEKRQIFNERIQKILGEFQALNSQDLESLANSGRMSSGKNLESSSLGRLAEPAVKNLASSFRVGPSELTSNIESLFNLFNQFSEDIAREAEERVDQRLSGSEGGAEQAADQNRPESENQPPEKETSPEEILPNSPEAEQGPGP